MKQVTMTKARRAVFLGIIILFAIFFRIENEGERERVIKI